MSNVKTINFGELSTQVESRLSFQPDPAVNKGLCIGGISDVRIEEIEVPKVKEDGSVSSWEFAGLKLPNLIIEFKQVNNDAKDKSERFLVSVEKPIGGKANGEALEVNVWEDLFIQQYNRLQHIVNALDAAGIQPLSKKLGAISISSNDEPQARIAKTKKLYEHFLKHIKGDGEKPKYDKVLFWMRVVANVDGNRYTLPTYVNKGFIEVITNGQNPKISIAPNDSLVLTPRRKKGEVAQAGEHGNAGAVSGTNAPKSVDDVLKGLGY